MRLRIVLLALLATALLAAGGRLRTLTYRGGGQGKVVFDHQLHASQGFRCDDCHTNFAGSGKVPVATARCNEEAPFVNDDAAPMAPLDKGRQLLPTAGHGVVRLHLGVGFRVGHTLASHNQEPLAHNRGHRTGARSRQVLGQSGPLSAGESEDVHRLDREIEYFARGAGGCAPANSVMKSFFVLVCAVTCMYWSESPISFAITSAPFVVMALTQAAS